MKNFKKLWMIKINFKKNVKNSVEISTDAQEQFCNYKINEFNKQLAGVQQEVESLKWNNSVLRTNDAEKDEKTNTVLRIY